MTPLKPFLCDYCQNILKGRIAQEEPPNSQLRSTRRPERPLGEFEQQAIKGCYSCYHVWTRLTASIQKHKRRPITTRIMDGKGGKVICEIVHSGGSEPYIKFWIFLEEDYRDHHYTQLSAFPCDFAKHETTSPGHSTQARQDTGQKITPEISASMDADSNWDLISQWLNGCVATSDDRPSRGKNPWFSMPTRLLDVRKLGRLRIVEARDGLFSKPKPKPYVAMSHCWGEQKFLTLTETTKKQLFHGFDEGLLARSFRDAVALTRKLGVSFLWIDSLCIFQDSKDDWRRESAQMAEVYSRAYCTIAATGAKDASEGLFIQRNPLMVQPFLVETCWQIPGQYSQTKQIPYFLTPNDYWGNMLVDNPLLSRSWVVQERILSKRIIHFSRSQIFWECAHKVACEVYPIEIPPLDGSFQTSAKSETTDMRDILTFASDRLAALAGIARAFGSDVSCGRYLAGIWEKNFLCQLNWRQTKSQPKATIEHHRAPSWSWAAVDGEIKCPGSYMDPEKTVFPTLQLLSVRTWDAPAYNENQRSFPRGFARVETTLYRGVIWKIPKRLEPSGFETVLKVSGWKSRHHFNHEIQAYLDYDYDDLSPYVYLMHFSMMPGTSYTYEQDFTITAVLLQRCAEVGDSSYMPKTALFQRVGVAIEEFRDSPRIPEIFSKFAGKKMRMKEHFEDRRMEVRDKQAYHFYTLTLV